MSRVWVGFLAACLSALSFAAHQAIAQQTSITVENVPIPVLQIAESPDELAFKNMLIKNSPWNVEFYNTTWQSTGTHQITFALGQDGATLTGMFLGTERSPPGPLKNIVFKKNCISLTLPTGSKYDYCLAGNSTLKGPYEGMTGGGTSFTGDAIAKPAAR